MVRRRWASPNKIIRFKHSSLMERMKHSAWAFALGARTGVSTVSIPMRAVCYQKMSSARASRGETLVLVMQPTQDRPTHDLALALGR